MSDNLVQDDIRVLLVGTGYMAREYAKVLEKIRVPYDVCGRNEKNCSEFGALFKVKVYAGGLEQFDIKEDYSHAIIASNIDSLYENCRTLIDWGIPWILLEKPGGVDSDEISALNLFATENGINVFLAYNRRFYASVLKAEEIAKDDGGVLSFNFEFTEWSHTISPLDLNVEIKNNWFLANSTHVIDTAFSIGGFPKEMCNYHDGALGWHKRSSRFAGAGISVKGAIFSYNANWEAPGRWSVEFLTRRHRLILRPMEILQIQNIGEVKINEVKIDDELDKKFKPGVFKQTMNFLNGNIERFCSLAVQADAVMRFYSKMSGY